MLSGEEGASVPISEAQLDDFRRLILRTLNDNQILILSNMPRVPTSITSILKAIFERFDIPISTLKLNAKILKDLNLITYGSTTSFRGAELTDLGLAILSLVRQEDLSVLRNLVSTQSGLQNLGAVITKIRKNVLRMIAEAGSGHLGGSLSAVEVLSVLYFLRMRHDPKNPGWGDRDRFILSKGHAAPTLYAVLAEAGYFPMSELSKFRESNSILQGHPDTQTPGIDVVSGSLGQGLSVANGMAMAAKMDGSDSTIYVLLGDGELDEGQVWEAAMTSAHYGLDNIVAIVDRNWFQLSGGTEDIKALEPIVDKWRAFGWNALEIDGNDPEQILSALERREVGRGMPTVIIARTTKGKGVPFMEGNVFSRRVPNETELQRALEGLD